MEPETRNKIISICLSLLILLGGGTVCILIEVVAAGPLMEDDGVKGMIMVFTAVAFLMSGFVSLLASIQGDLWVKKLQLSLEMLFLIATSTSFLALKDIVYLPLEGDCVAHANFTMCSCLDRVTNAPGQCEDVYNSRGAAYALVFLYIVIWIACVVDVVRVISISCTEPKTEEDIELPGIRDSEERFYNISYPSVDERRERHKHLGIFEKHKKSKK